MPNDFVHVFLNVASAETVAPMLLAGAIVTIKLIISIVPAAAIIGLVIAALRDLKVPGLRLILVLYVDLLRAAPPLVVLIYIYSALPFIGIRLSEFATVVLALTANGAAFFGEIFRAGLESVPIGQRDAARATGLNLLQTEMFVVIPQGVRKVIPPAASNVIELSKATALGSVVALPELLRAGRLGQSLVYDATPLVAVAVIYLIFLWPLVRLLSRLEQRMTTIAGRS